MRVRLAENTNIRRRPVPRRQAVSWSSLPRWDEASFSDSLPPQPPRRKLRKRRVALVLLALFVLATGISRTDNSPAGKSSADKNGFSKSQYSLTEASSPWVIVNKKRPLSPRDYTPKLTDPHVHLNQSAGSENMKVAMNMSPALERLFAAAQFANLPLALASGYRSYQTQVSVYDTEVATNGQQNADAESARPGYSEHQTGLAADIAPEDNRCVLDQCFGTTPEGIWLRDNAWRYGFIIRYPSDKASVTGYEYEPWHVRYIGNELAKDMHDKHIETLEEYFGTGNAPSY